MDEPSERGREFVGSEVAAGAFYISCFFCFVVNAILVAKGSELPTPAGTPTNFIETAEARNQIFLHKVSISLYAYILPTTTLI